MEPSPSNGLKPYNNDGSHNPFDLLLLGGSVVVYSIAIEIRASPDSITKLIAMLSKDGNLKRKLAVTTYCVCCQPQTYLSASK